MQILQQQIKPAEFIRTVHTATPEPGTNLEDMLKPEYWTHVAKGLRKGDHIEVVAADGAWFAELFVRSVTDNAVTVAVLRQVAFDPPKQPAVAGEPFTVKHRGGAGWSVIRNVDKAVVFEKGATREEAEAWLDEQTALA